MLSLIQHDGLINIAVAPSRRSTNWRNKELLWSEFVASFAIVTRTQESQAEYAAWPKARRDECKDTGGFVGGRLKGGRRKGTAVASRRLLTLDFDYIPEGTDPWQVVVLVLGCAAVLYSTHSHTPKSPRLRMVIPLSRDVTPDEYEAVARRVAADISMDMIDDTSFESARLMYNASCSYDAEYRYEVNDEPWLDPDEQLMRYTDWTDPTQWPTSSRKAEAHKRVAAKQGYPLAKSGIIGAFCRVYDIPAAIETFLPETYLQCEGKDRYTFAGGSTSGGLVMYEEGLFAYSHHGTDPISGKLVNAFDLVRLHMFGDLDDEVPSETAIADMPSQKAMAKFALEDEGVRAELEATRVAEIKGEFDTEAYFVEQVGLLTVLHPDSNERYSWDDQGGGRLFADVFKDQARYVMERKMFFVYDGITWRPDICGLKAMALCKKLADCLLIYATSIIDERQRLDYLKHIRRWHQRSYREIVIKDAADVYPISASTFDTDPFLFNCLNGTPNLLTSEFHEHRSQDMLSKLSGVRYEPGAHCARWVRFIDEITCGDNELARYLQKALGYALTGDTSRECLFILYGPTTRNGKGSLMETFLKLMGDYGRTAQPGALAQKWKANSGAPSEDIARLAGARFVNISEPSKNLVLDAALVKSLTGRDTINARFLNENSFEFRPQFTLFINTNHLPVVTDTSLFTSGRVKIILFLRHFEDEEQDKSLKDEFAKHENLSGILNWCLEGLRLIEEEGFDMPASVLAATDDYNRESDKIGRFFDEEMEKDAHAETRTAEVYARYQAWCIRNGFHPENIANFKDSVSRTAKVVRKRPISGEALTTLLLGYRLKSEYDSF